MSERKAQNKVIDFFCNTLKYNYLGNLKNIENKNIKQSRLFDFLSAKGYSEHLCNAAIDKLSRTAANMQHGVYDANKEVYCMLKYGTSVSDGTSSAPKTVYFIDFDCPANNDFAIAEEVTIKETQEKRPDLVIYLNGIAVAVLEMKSSIVLVSKGIRQNLTNQKDMFIEPFFTTIQFCMAANETEGLRYGTLKTDEIHYTEWKPDGYPEHQDERDEMDIRIEERIKGIDEFLQKQIYSMFDKTRFLDLIKNFIVFDNGWKKVCRYNQYYAVKRTMNRISKNQGGIIWHTQGSGKTLTMIWLSKLILSRNSNARVLIVTDREELDEQIERNFIGAGEKNIARTNSCEDLVHKLNTYDDCLLCSLIHKFGKRTKKEEQSEIDYDTSYNKYIEDLKKALPSGFKAKGDLYVFVDECHRTQSGKLHAAMKNIMPNAVFVGFTGTPLLKKDKATSVEIFGTYIHTYKYNEAVEDGVVLDLLYDARDIPQDISSKEKIDLWFEAKTSGLAPRAKAKLKAKWGNIQKVYSSRSRLDKIVNDIILDFETKPRLMDGNGNAILVADSIYSACKYYDIFISKGFRKCAIISSYSPLPGDLRTDTVSDEEDTETFEKYETYIKMIGLDPNNLPEKVYLHKRIDDFEKEKKRLFEKEPKNMKVLIVVDKLLTGYDAPPCTYLYIDKSMHDHGLFQAICRVNRLDGKTKDFGYIVDYKQLFGNLTDAINKYTSSAFEGYDKEDIKDLIKDRKTEAIKNFILVYEEIEELCEGVEQPKEDLQFLHYFCGESGKDESLDEAYLRLREKFYKLVSSLMRSFANAKPYMNTNEFSASDISKYENKVRFYLIQRQKIGLKSGDFLDLKAYEPGMRHLIDNYIVASDSETVGEFNDLTLLDFVKEQGKVLSSGDESKSLKESAAEAIENNIRRKIVEKIIINPKYYNKMSLILEDLIEERRKGVKSYREFLIKCINLVKNIENPESNIDYPENIRKSEGLMALYDNTGCDEKLAVKLHNAVLNSAEKGFRTDEAKMEMVKESIDNIINDDDEVERIYKIIESQEEY